MNYNAFPQVSLPILGIIENMVYFKCPSCEVHHPLYGETPLSCRVRGTAADVPVLTSLPMEPRVVRDCDQGTPSVIGNEDIGLLFEQVTEQILPMLKLDDS